MSRRRLQKYEAVNSSFGLNITSMTDMFTILLVFLLQTYSVSEVQINPEKGLKLPASQSTVEAVKGLKISISQDSLIVEGQVIASLKNQHFQAQDLEKNDSSVIIPLMKQLTTLTANNTADKNNDKAAPQKVLLQADVNTSYEDIKKILYTSSLAGLSEIKLVTLVGN